MNPTEFRLRVVYAKEGRLRWLSHLEVVRTLERIIRRAQLPYAVTQGFNAHMKAGFGHALPVGTAGRNEYFDVWLTRYTDASDALSALRRSAPALLAPHTARYVGEREPSLTAGTVVARYETELTGKEIDPTDVQEALARTVDAKVLEVEHKKGAIKVFDLTRALSEEVRVRVAEDGPVIELSVRIGPEGSLRPESLVRQALATTAAKDATLRTTRLELLVESSEGVWSRPV